MPTAFEYYLRIRIFKNLPTALHRTGDRTSVTGTFNLMTRPFSSAINLSTHESLVNRRSALRLGLRSLSNSNSFSICRELNKLNINGNCVYNYSILHSELFILLSRLINSQFVTTTTTIAAADDATTTTSQVEKKKNYSYL